MFALFGPHERRVKRGKLLNTSKKQMNALAAIPLSKVLFYNVESDVLIGE
jgi:ribosomal protein L21